MFAVSHIFVPDPEPFYPLPLSNPIIPPIDEIRIYNHNVSGMRTKIREFNAFLVNCPFNLVIFEETWLHPSIPDAELSGQTGFSAFRVDRLLPTDTLSSKGGGVAIFCKSYLNPSLVQISKPLNLELVAVEFSCRDTDIICIACYFPPNPSKTYEASKEFRSIIGEIVNNHKEKIILVFGDFNLPDIKWHRDSDCPAFLSPVHSIHTSVPSQHFLETINENNLYQISDQLRPDDTTLDLILTNSPSGTYVEAASMPESFPSSQRHHIPTIMGLPVRSASAASSASKQTTSVNYNGAETYLRYVLKLIDPSKIESGNDVDFLIDNINTAIEANSRVKLDKIKTGHPWIRNDAAYVELKRKYRIAYRSYRKSRTENDKKEQLSLLNQMRARFSTLRDDHFARIIENHSNYKDLFTFAKNKTAPHETLPAIMHDNGVRLTAACRNRRMATHLAANMGIAEDSFAAGMAYPPTDVDTNEEDLLSPNNVSPIEEYLISETELKSILNQIDPKKDCGPMGITQTFLINAVYLHAHLTRAINVMIRLGHFPRQLKTSYLIPIPKKGRPNEISNYRGIAIQSVLMKVIDKHLTARLAHDTRHLMDPCQHGFQPSRSTLSNLTEFVHKVQSSLAKKIPVDCIFFDFSRAFDTISHSILRDKLSSLGLHRHKIRTILRFIQNRVYIVKIDNQETEFLIYPNRGVPQGSHIGPLIYLLYCIDFQTLLQSVGYLVYADDTKIFLPITNPSSARTLQCAIDALSNWSAANELTLNPSKTFHMHFSTLTNPQIHSYTLHNTTIALTQSHKDLGVWLDPKLKFHVHVSHIVAKGTQALGAIWRTCNDLRSPGLARIMFLTYVQPILEYCAQIWDRKYIVDSQKIEALLHSASRIALSSPKFPHQRGYVPFEDRIKTLRLTTLSHRRFISRCLRAVKVWQGSSYSPTILQLINNCTYNRSSGPTTRRPNRFNNIRAFAPLDSIGGEALLCLNWLSNVVDLDTSPASIKQSLLELSSLPNFGCV